MQKEKAGVSAVVLAVVPWVLGSDCPRGLLACPCHPPVVSQALHGALGWGLAQKAAPGPGFASAPPRCFSPRPLLAEAISRRLLPPRGLGLLLQPSSSSSSVAGSREVKKNLGRAEVSAGC